ncbi:hypothetical protein N2152v2_010492 [Parachlorella kessleri]
MALAPMCNSIDVAAAMLAQFEALAKTGKPQPHEHTVLAGIALTLPPHESLLRPAALQPDGQGMPSANQPLPATLITVALATGTKCLTASKRDPSGRALNDFHAEVCCRCALLRWLYCEMLETVRLYRSGVQDGTAVLQLLRREQQQHQLLPAGTEAAAAGGAAGSAESGAQEVATEDPDPAVSASGFQEKLPTLSGWQFVLRPGVQLHMFISQPPCGDASIYDGAGPASYNSEPSADVLGSAAGQHDPLAQEHGQQQHTPQQAVAHGLTSAQPRLYLGRTGAKPIKRAKLLQKQRMAVAAHNASPAAAAAAGKAWAVPQAHEVESYGEAQLEGVVRRKPGRGEATLSLSCSDKLARWRLLGLQGSLLSGLLAAPLHLSSITVAISTPCSAGQGCCASGSLPVAEAAVEAPCPAAVGQAAAAAAAVEAAAEAALRMALVERTMPLVGRLPGRFQHAVPALQARVVSLSNAPHYNAATDGGSTSQAAQQVPAPHQRPTLASKQQGSPSGGVGVVLLQRLLQLGLVPGNRRRVAGGSTLLWHAPRSTEFLANCGLEAVAGGVRRGGQERQQQEQQGQGCSKGWAAAPGRVATSPRSHEGNSPAPTLYTVKGGTQQAVAGTTGLKLGVSRMAAALPPTAAAPCACKEALARLFLQVARELGSLPQDVAEDLAAGLNPASGGVVEAGGPAAPMEDPVAAPAGGAESAVVAGTSGTAFMGVGEQDGAGRQR